MSNTTTTTATLSTSEQASLALHQIQACAERFETFAHETLERSEKFQAECAELSALLERLKTNSIFSK